MRRNQKIHAIAIASICVLVTVIYTLVTPTASTPPQPSGDRSIEIFDATWGKSCNPLIATALKNPPPVSADGKPAPIKPSLVQDNNVLTPVSNLCNGQLSCQIKAASDSFGIEPLEACFKRLVVRYRCFSYDRAWDVTTNQGETLTIDCNAPPPPASKP